MYRENDAKRLIYSNTAFQQVCCNIVTICYDLLLNPIQYTSKDTATEEVK